MTTMASSRERYGETLLDLGSRNEDIVVVGGDLNVSVCVAPFGKKFPDRFFDLGAAEQNMMSIAAGLASTGKIPFVSTFAVFGSGRAFDQVRVGISQSNLNVKIVVTHSGLITGEDGISAQSIEDLSLMCSLPAFNVVVPADARETEQAVETAANTHGPFYIRLGRPATEIITPHHYQFKLGKAATLREGKDASIIACGIMTGAALQAADRLAQSGIECRVLNMATLQPADEEAIIRAASETGAIVTAEEHLPHGGLGSIVASIASRCRPVPIEFVAVNNYAESGRPDELLERYHLSPVDVEKAVRTVVARKGSN